MGSQSFRDLLSDARLAPYLRAVGGDRERAWTLYLWANELSGAWHSQISLVEIAVRNAIDRELRRWNALQGSHFEWTREHQAAEPLYSPLKSQLRRARNDATREAGRRPSTHPRFGNPVTHDDVVAQLMFGAWVTLIRPMSPHESSTNQEHLWRAATSHAFPGASADDIGRNKIGRQLDSIRRLRNRVAHHDNLLHVDSSSRLNGALSVLNAIDPTYPELAMARSTVRRIVRDDPRRR